MKAGSLGRGLVRHTPREAEAPRTDIGVGSCLPPMKQCKMVGLSGRHREVGLGFQTASVEPPEGPERQEGPNQEPGSTGRGIAGQRGPRGLREPRGCARMCMCSRCRGEGEGGAGARLEVDWETPCPTTCGKLPS